MLPECVGGYKLQAGKLRKDQDERAQHAINKRRAGSVQLLVGIHGQRRLAYELQGRRSTDSAG